MNFGEYSTITVKPFESNVRVRFYREQDVWDMAKDQKERKASAWETPGHPSGPFEVLKGHAKAIAVPSGSTHALLAYSANLPLPATVNNISRFARLQSVAKTRLTAPCYEAVALTPATSVNLQHLSHYLC